MSSISDKAKAVQYVSAQINTGSPSEDEQKNSIKTFLADTLSNVDAPTASESYTIDSSTTILVSGLTATTTIELTATEFLPIGAVVKLVISQDGTGRNITWGANITGDDLTGVANDVDVAEITYVGNDSFDFVVTNLYKAVDAA